MSTVSQPPVPTPAPPSAEPAAHGAERIPVPAEAGRDGGAGDGARGERDMSFEELRMGSLSVRELLLAIQTEFGVRRTAEPGATSCPS